MARVSLPPGFRFHPTDVELIMYLRRKFMGKLGRFNYILEIDIYKFAPWDLPDKSYLKSRDLEWYFYCPRNRKYSNGARTNRATDIGYWKTTGKDRPICDNNNQTVGMKKTLIFHLGRPQGERTNWVMHEYRLEEKGLADIGISPDEYVICKFFEKSGPGPKNGEQHGAPFKEEDWDDEVGNDSLACFPIAGAPLPLGSEDGQVMVVANSTAKVTEVEPVVKISEVDAVPQQSTGSAVVEEHFTLPENDALNEMLLNFFPVDDGGLSMDDGGLVSHVNGNNENLETTKLHEIALENPTHMEEADIYIGLEDLSPPPNPVDRFHFHHALEDVYAPYQVLPDAHGYLELNDLKYPMEAVNSGYDTSSRHQNFSNLEDFPNSGAPLCSTLSDSGSCSMLSGRSDIYEDPPLTVVSEMDCFRGRSYASWEFQANPDHSAAAPLIIKQANLFCRLPQAIPYPHRHSD